jgi:hypothetical protein
VPLAFPSHQGLILPLWRRYPRAIDGVALCIGAAMPDVVDGLAWFGRRQVGQWLGHSLVGLPLLCVPFGVAFAWLFRRVAPARWIRRLDPFEPSAGRAIASVAIGAASHVAIDLVTHGSFPLLLPWYRNDHVFPSWWYRSWGGVRLPIYAQPYPIAPHTIAWAIASVVGIVLFVRCLSRRRDILEE